MQEEYLTVQQAADILHKHPQTIYKMIRSGKLVGYRPFSKAKNGRIIITKDNLEKFIRSNDTNADI